MRRRRAGNFEDICGITQWLVMRNEKEAVELLSLEGDRHCNGWEVSKGESLWFPNDEFNEPWKILFL